MSINPSLGGSGWTVPPITPPSNSSGTASQGTRMLRPSRTGAKVFGLGRTGTNAASAFGYVAGTAPILTFANMFDVEADFDQVAIIYGNKSSANTLPITKVTLAVGTTATDKVNDAAFSSPVQAKFSGNNTITIPAATQIMDSSYFPSLVVTDWVDLSSVDRTDVVGARPLLYVRTEVSPSAGTDLITTQSLTGSNKGYNSANPDVFGRYVMGSFQGSATGKATGALGNTPTGGNYILPLGFMYKSRSGRVMVVCATGDSITRGFGSSSQGTTWLEKTVQGINNGNVANIALKSPYPVDFINLGWDSTTGDKWVYAMTQLIAAGIIPTCAIFPNFTPNGGTNAANLRNAVKLATMCDDNRIFPLIWGGIPAGLATTPDAARLAYNTIAQSIDCQYVDFNSAVSDGATPQNIQVALRTDTLHPNDAGDTAIAGVLQPKIAALNTAYFSGKTT